MCVYTGDDPLQCWALDCGTLLPGAGRLDLQRLQHRPALQHRPRHASMSWRQSHSASRPSQTRSVLSLGPPGVRTRDASYAPLFEIFLLYDSLFMRACAVPHASQVLQGSVEYGRWMGFLKLPVSFRKRATDHGALSMKLTCKDKALYGSLPPCTYQCIWCDIWDTCWVYVLCANCVSTKFGEP